MNRIARSLWGYVWPIAVGCSVALLLINFVVSVARVPTSSMRPMLTDPCRVVVNHLATEFSPIKEGEVVLFHWPDDPSQVFVKRVIGLPGDVIQVKNGIVYRNHKPLQEPYLKEPINENSDYGPVQVPKDSYFMMGDNRNVSDDSRFWKHPFVSKRAIIGRAEFVFWPLSEVHKVK